MKHVLPLAVLGGLLCGAASAGTLSPGLEARLAGVGEEEVVRVLVVLRDQVDLPALDRELRAEKATTRARHGRVVTALRDLAEASQAGLQASLGADKAAGEVLGFRSHWLLNSVVVTAPVRVVRKIAARSDVATVEPDLVVELIEPRPEAKEVPADKAAAGIGIAPGVAAVNAPRVWRELGIDGTGVVVGILDTGVDGHHPALAARWRGNFAPAAECWLDASGLGDESFPVDRHFHGTHVMGTLTGAAPGDTIGVAPGAHWIASNLLNFPGTWPEFDNAVIASFEFMADPDGDPTTTDDVPAVVENSWGVRADDVNLFPCDSRWWDAIDALEAAGVVVVWAAGNEGPGAGSLRSPPDRASSPLNAFAVGSTATSAPYAVSFFSSRGPSLCGGPYEIKPEVVAPGSAIYSAQPGGGYRYLSGTSMAGPHVAGIVALMRAASPDADVATIKQALMSTAVDLGTPGEDNDSGWGLVDAYAAVLAVKAGVGEVLGTVTDDADGRPVAGVDVRLEGGFHATVTDTTGAFRIVLPAGPSAFAVTAFGYVDGRLEVTVPDGGVASGDLALVPHPRAPVSGRVTGPGGGAVPGAVISVDGTPLAPVTTDAAGDYGLELPAGPGMGYVVRARAPGYGSTLAYVALGGPVTRDFVLPPAVVEDFETGGFGALPWGRGGDAGWEIDADIAFAGRHSARSGAVGARGISRLQLPYAVLDAGEVVFRCRVSSEAGYDFLRFYVDGRLQGSWSGEVPWTEVRAPLSSGAHVLAWAYEKDEADDVGADAAWVDLVELPAPATAPQPVVDVAPAILELAAVSGQAATAELTVANTGAADLVYGVASFASAPTKAAGPASPAPTLKGAADDRAPVIRPAGAGGPDRFGYRWRDSDDPLGPTYAWVDIAADGTPLTLGDDDVTGPIPLGFTFPFYGDQLTGVRIASDGFLAFGSVGGAVWANQAIPDPAPPNHLLAAFWDDLDPGAGGAVFWRSEPDRFLVQYQDVPHFGAPGATETFQVVLGADGVITYQYAAVGDDGGCTVGLENAAGDDGLLVQFNDRGGLRPGLAVAFRAEPRPAWLAFAPAGGTVAPAGQAVISVTADAAALAPGVYAAFIDVSSDDPDRGVVVVPVTLTVRDPADADPDLPAAVLMTGAVPNPFNPATEIRFGLPREARVTLRIYDVAGRLVRELLDGRLPAGPHGVFWDGRGRNGRAVASGTYMARLVVDGAPHTKAMTLLR